MATETANKLREALNSFGRAWEEGDSERLRALLTDSYTHNDANGGRRTGENFLQLAEGWRGRLAGLAFHDVQIRVIDTTGIVSGVSVLRSKPPAPGQPEQVTRLTFLQVWLLREGQWRIEAYQATPLAIPAGFGSVITSRAD